MKVWVYRYPVIIRAWRFLCRHREEVKTVAVYFFLGASIINVVLFGVLVSIYKDVFSTVKMVKAIQVEEVRVLNKLSRIISQDGEDLMIPVK